MKAPTAKFGKRRIAKSMVKAIAGGARIAPFTSALNRIWPIRRRSRDRLAHASIASQRRRRRRRRRLEPHPAAGHDIAAIGHRKCLQGILLDHQDADPGGGDLPDAPNISATRQPGRGRVEQQETRGDHQGHRQRHHLPLAAREAAGALAPAADQPRELSEDRGAPAQIVTRFDVVSEFQHAFKMKLHSIHFMDCVITAS